MEDALPFHTHVPRAFVRDEGLGSEGAQGKPSNEVARLEKVRKASLKAFGGGDT